MSDWYARRLARHRTEQGQPMVPYARQAPLQQPPQPPQHVPFQQAAQEYFEPPKGATTVDNLYQMMGRWKGGKAHKIDSEPCPECGSNQYFSRTDGHRRGPPPAPHCYNCGFNGLFTQGLESNWSG